MHARKNRYAVVLPLRGKRLPVLRPKKDEGPSLVFLSPTVELYQVHGSKEGTLVCTLNPKTCQGCKNKKPWSVYGALHAYNTDTKQEVVLLITAEGVHNLRDEFGRDDALRGEYAVVKRYQNRANMPLVFTRRATWPEAELPAAAKPTRPSLERLWTFHPDDVDSAKVAG